ncbi:uncharacterized protein F4812DRAFT_295929 [Daldinia caldariorum]|uniref:uncharacterized protein n=1 Tax=Daldinia caldariorum TaxID=326644 RepID=UPI002007C2CE|nr:uncharacterized protein F4812DRAFT_295929 [Daldinia caldariorum]KAI1469594.1 hypothetical protein F4812DRAFT_295929 [Daldinia caldariorum]
MPPKKGVSEQHRDIQLSKKEFKKNQRSSTITDDQIDEAVKGYQCKPVEATQRPYHECTRLGVNDKEMVGSAKDSWQYWTNVLRNHKPRFPAEFDQICQLLTTKIHMGGKPTSSVLYQNARAKLVEIAKICQDCDNQFDPEKCAELHYPTCAELEALRIYGDTAEGFGTFPTPIADLLKKTDLVWSLQWGDQQQPTRGFWGDYVQSCMQPKRPAATDEGSLSKRARLSGPEVPNAEGLEERDLDSQNALTAIQSAKEEIISEMKKEMGEMKKETREMKKEALEEMRSSKKEVIEEITSLNNNVYGSIQNDKLKKHNENASSNEDDDSDDTSDIVLSLVGPTLGFTN